MVSDLINTKQLKGNEGNKHRRKKRILRLLYNHDSLSGPAISKRLGVSLPTTLNLLTDLKESSFIESRGIGVSKGGRKPNLYGLSNNTIFILACELGRYEARMAIYNVQNEAVSQIIVFDTNIDDHELADKIYKNSTRLLRKNKIKQDRLLGLGITMPGLVDESKGINYSIKIQEYQNIRERLEQKFQKPVYVNNDARMQAYGEYKFGAAKGKRNAIVVNWNWGIGMGMILDGRLYNGATGFAGELSHTKFENNGKLCICGKRGCLETITSVYSILKNARNGIEKGTITQLSNKFKKRLDQLKADDVITAARSGDEFSISLLHNAGLALGEGLSTTIQLLNPDVIVIGGPVARANQFVLTPIHQSLNKYCLEQILTNTKIVISENWEQSGLLGITAMLFQKLFSDI